MTTLRSTHLSAFEKTWMIVSFAVALFWLLYGG